ncbi:MAG: hypothetical protein ABI416_09755, partial [Ginsengibacter sp.]
FDTTKNYTERYKNRAFLFDPNIKQIGIVTDEYCYVHNLLNGTEDFRSARNDSALTQTYGSGEDRKAIKTLSQAYYETARYMMLNNLKRNTTIAGNK